MMASVKVYECNYVIEGKRYTQIVEATSPGAAERTVNGQIQNIGKQITSFQTREIRR